MVSRANFTTTEAEDIKFDLYDYVSSRWAFCPIYFVFISGCDVFFSYIAACNDGENLLMTFCLKITLKRDAQISLKGVFPCQRISVPHSLSEKHSRFDRNVTVLFTIVLALLWVSCFLLCC